MRTMRINSTTIYIAKKLSASEYSTDLITIKVPIKKVNSKPLVLTGGTSEREKVSFVCMNDKLDLFSKGDRVYVYTTPPTDMGKLAKGYDYTIIETPIRSVNSFSTLLEKSK